MNTHTLQQIRHSSDIIIRLMDSIERYESQLDEFKGKPKYYTLEHAIRNFKFELKQEEGILIEFIAKL